MNTKKPFDGDELYVYIKGLPGGAPQMLALQDAIRQADEEKDAFWQLYFRYNYACEATFRDDPPKAIPAAAEFAAILEANHDAMIADMGEEVYLMITQMGIDPIVYLPQISRKQWEALMEQFHALVKRYRLGLRTYWWQMARFWQYIDREKAFEYFQKFWETERDNLSDCEACEYSYGVQMSLLMGDRKGAERYARPMETHRIQLCTDVPQLYWLAYLEDAMDRGDLKEAKPLANKLYQKGNRDKSDLSYLGAVLRCWAYTNLDQAMTILAQRLEWTLEMWDQKKVYDFYKGAWVCLRVLHKRQGTMKLNLPKDFPLYQEDSCYDCGVLEKWFYDQAELIGRRFDKRNGSDYFAKDLALAGHENISTAT